MWLETLDQIEHEVPRLARAFDRAAANSIASPMEGKHQNPWGQRSCHRRLNVQTPTSNAPLPFQTEDGWPFDPTDFDASPKERREEIADRLHSPPHGPRAALGRTAAEHAAVVLDRYLVDVSRRSFGQCAPPQRTVRARGTVYCHKVAVAQRQRKIVAT